MEVYRYSIAWAFPGGNNLLLLLESNQRLRTPQDVALFANYFMPPPPDGVALFANDVSQK